MVTKTLDMRSVSNETDRAVLEQIDRAVSNLDGNMPALTKQPVKTSWWHYDLFYSWGKAPFTLSVRRAAEALLDNNVVEDVVVHREGLKLRVHNFRYFENEKAALSAASKTVRASHSINEASEARTAASPSPSSQTVSEGTRANTGHGNSGPGGGTDGDMRRPPAKRRLSELDSSSAHASDSDWSTHRSTKRYRAASYSADVPTALTF